MFGDKKLAAENVRLVKENLKLWGQCQRLRFPTGREISAEGMEEKLARPGAAQMEGVDELLLLHIWEHSGDAFDAEIEGERRAYYSGAAAGLSQFRADLVERGVIPG